MQTGKSYDLHGATNKTNKTTASEKHSVVQFTKDNLTEWKKLSENVNNESFSPAPLWYDVFVWMCVVLVFQDGNWNVSESLLSRAQNRIVWKRVKLEEKIVSFTKCDEATECSIQRCNDECREKGGNVVMWWELYPSFACIWLSRPRIAAAVGAKNSCAHSVCSVASFKF